ncbi:carbohydrate ABC transporter ATP-binding protein, CUT1 family (TC 3.A.1.1.-) [Promicromonospora umidemergens]|uniref:ABC transporter ATP-binding protein n=1 Tax=Promicromonospora umidemergens TaxID=629679 RepID=A0ABP8WIT3_9MICO|nr:ABC transporter ATP-binding protein [Promicromonospora umidemergens]MCP2284047.1 carbohydrate ABC transporter ATP-binding protein, CUT1 family (TC 3.A.1.1.-) [Promicromonospora umidemergens]
MTTISIQGLGKRFGTSVAVRDVSLEVPSGAFVVLLGPSGCGKTTTLRMLAGLDEPTSGVIRFGDRVVADGGSAYSLPPEKRHLGMVFQSYALWPHMTVRQNIEWPLSVAGWSRSERTARVDEVLASLEITQLADRSPAQVSGGQQQRVAIARTIAPRPEVVLFDEPLSNLDARLRVETRAELGRVHRENDATSVYVTHDQVEALSLATHIAVMKDGLVEQFGAPSELLERPATAFVASFLGSPPAVLLSGHADAGSFVHRGVPIAAVPAGTSPAQAMYRPQDVRLDPEGTFAFEILESTPAAGMHLVTGYVGSGQEERERVTVVSDRPAVPGDATRLRLPDAPAALFGQEGGRL